MITPGRFQPPSRQMVVYGEPVAQALPRVAKEFWVTQTVIVTNTSLTGEGSLTARVSGILGDTLKNTVTGIRANSPRQDVVRIATALRSRGVEAVVAIGGGSVVEAVKAARICLTNNVRNAADLDRLKTATTAASPRPYLISIPTTLSGAEYTQYAGITDERTGVKDAFHHQDLAPDAVILDPEMTLVTPRQLWLSTGLRAIDHAIETWCAKKPTPYSDATSLYAARVLARWLPVSSKEPENLEARLACQVAAWMSIQGATVGVSHGASHGIGHALSAVTGMTHGITSCIMLPHVLRYNLPVSRERQDILAMTMGRPGEQLADIVSGIVADLGLPGRLRDAGVERDQIPAIAKAALANPRIKANIRAIESEREMTGIIEAAF
ncbi:iron-containing alcohol dehydrogenase [Mesorhizobium sp. CCNWLW179-1]|uniref:iron-containing alcohol dehydrogenase n=1 Tax=unclassified Mesorhizobium TaxID=325217 RepID=UPI003014F8C8